MNNLKYLATLLLAATLMLGCVDDKKTGSNGDLSTSDNSSTTGTTGSYATPVAPNPNQPRVQLLMRNAYWVAEYWVNHADNTQNAPNRGRWWTFRPDGTFLTGQWEETLSEGSWVVYFDGEKDLLHLDAANDNLDMEFQLQAVSNEEDYMSWVGTSLYGMSRIAVKAIALGSMPTKAQFGIQN